MRVFFIHHVGLFIHLYGGIENLDKASVHYSNFVHVDQPLMNRYTCVSNWQGFFWQRLSNMNTPLISPSVTMLFGVCSWCLEYSWLTQESSSLVWILFGVWVLPRSGVLSRNGSILILHLSLLLWGMSRLFWASISFALKISSEFKSCKNEWVFHTCWYYSSDFVGMNKNYLV